MIRPFHHAQFPLELLRERKQERSRSCCRRGRWRTRSARSSSGCSPLGLIDQLLVVDAASQDGTADIAASLGADVRQESQLLPEFGQVLGKGDAMWRALDAAEGELIVYLDSDTRDFSPRTSPPACSAR